MSTFSYCIKQGFRNFFKNPLFTLASVITVSACIFLFCMFLSIAANLQSFLVSAETNVGITVFFEPGISSSKKEDIRVKSIEFGGVKEIKYISADEAWEDFKKSYFGDDYAELSTAFDGENPLADSDSYEIFMDDIEMQTEMVAMLRKLDGVREVNYASSAVTLLKKINSWIYGLSGIIITILFAVSVFLISNTINVAAAFRKRENEIMKMIGAKNSMIRSPFVIEGLLIGILGSVIPIICIRLLYSEVNVWMSAQLEALTGSEIMKDVFTLVPFEELFDQMVIVSAILGIGVALLVSTLTINSHLRKMK